MNRTNFKSLIEKGDKMKTYGKKKKSNKKKSNKKRVVKKNYGKKY